MLVDPSHAAVVPESKVSLNSVVVADGVVEVLVGAAVATDVEVAVAGGVLVAVAVVGTVTVIMALAATAPEVAFNVCCPAAACAGMVSDVVNVPVFLLVTLGMPVLDPSRVKRTV